MKEKLNLVNWNSIFLTFRNWFSKNLILLLILPLIINTIIFITNGEEIDKVITENSEFLKLFQLNTQLKVLNETEIPYYVKSLGYDSVILIIVLFFIWLLNHTLYCYLQLSHKTGSKVLLVVETILLLLIFIFIVSPHFPLLIFVFGYALLAIQIILIALYWVYSLKFNE
jgi:hypothetical protein